MQDDNVSHNSRGLSEVEVQTQTRTALLAAFGFEESARDFPAVTLNLRQPAPRSPTSYDFSEERGDGGSTISQYLHDNEPPSDREST